MSSLFTQAVYTATRRIPRGRVTTYALLARAVAHPGAVRAVGNALHRNPTPGPVPCHRVVSSSGDIGGYVYGRRRKAELLRAEGVPVDSIGKIIEFPNFLISNS